MTKPPHVVKHHTPGWNPQPTLSDCVMCEDCGFRYGAEHTNADGSYSCPLCELQVLERFRDAVRDCLAAARAVEDGAAAKPQAGDDGH